MPKIEFISSARSVTVSRGTNLKDICEEIDCGIVFGCGVAACGSCKIRPRNAKALSPPTEREKDFLEDSEFAQGIRLACQCIILGDTAIETDL